MQKIWLQNPSILNHICLKKKIENFCSRLLISFDFIFKKKKENQVTWVFMRTEN